MFYSRSRDHNESLYSNSFRSTSSCSQNSSNSYYMSSSSLSSSSNHDIMISCFAPHHSYCVATLKAQTHHHITCLAVHGNILYAGSGNDISAFDLTSFSPINDPGFFSDGRDLSSGGFIKSIAFHGDNILTAHQDSRIRVWKRHRLVATLPTIKDKLSRFLSPKSYVQVRRHKRKLWIEHNDAVSGLAVSPNDGYIYSVSWDKTLKIWRASDFKCMESLTAHEDAVNAITVSVKGTVYTGSADGRIRVWERKGNDRVGRHHIVSTLEKHASTVNALALTNDGRVLFSGGCDGVVMAWEKNEDDLMVKSGIVGGHDGAVLCLISMGLDGQDLFVSGSADRTVRIWGRGVSGQFCCLGVFQGHKRSVRSLAVKKLVDDDDDENDVVLVCSGSLDGEIKVWQVMVSELIN